MADYIPIFVPSKIVTLTASALVTAGDLLVVSGAGTVAKCASAAAVNWIGVAAQDVVLNQRCALYARGYVHESVSEGSVTAGDELVTSSVAGRQVKTLAAAVTNTAADINLARARIGVAITSSADGARVRWMEF